MSIKSIVSAALVTTAAVALSIPAMAGQVGSGSLNKYGSGASASSSHQDIIGGIRTTSLKVDSIMNIASFNGATKQWAEVSADDFYTEANLSSSSYKIPCLNTYNEKLSADAYVDGTLLVSKGSSVTATAVHGQETVHLTSNEALLLGRGYESASANEAYRFHDSSSYSNF